MKRIILLGLVVITLLSGCMSVEDAKRGGYNNSSIVNDNRDVKNKNKDAKSGEYSTSSIPVDSGDVKNQNMDEALNKVDSEQTEYDTSSMSDVMAFATIQSIYMKANEFVGKKLIMSGTLEEKGGRYFCVIRDKAGCCEMPMEIDIKKKDAENIGIGNNIKVNGIVDIEEENNTKYVRLIKVSVDIL